MAADWRGTCCWHDYGRALINKCRLFFQTLERILSFGVTAWPKHIRRYHLAWLLLWQSLACCAECRQIRRACVPPARSKLYTYGSCHTACHTAPGGCHVLSLTSSSSSPIGIGFCQSRDLIGVVWDPLRCTSCRYIIATDLWIDNQLCYSANFVCVPQNASKSSSSECRNRWHQLDCRQRPLWHTRPYIACLVSSGQQETECVKIVEHCYHTYVQASSRRPFETSRPIRLRRLFHDLGMTDDILAVPFSI